MQGIYCIEHVESRRKYYGSSMNVAKRLTQHKTDLINQKHHNIHLQRAANKYGLNQFNFYLLEETYFVTKKELLRYEQLFLDKNKDGYNMAPADGGDCISAHPDRDKIVEKIRQTNIARFRSMSPEERKEKYGKTGAKNGNYRNGGVSRKLCPKCNANLISNKSQHCGKCRDRTKENNSFYGKHHSEETKQILRKKMSGNNSWIKGIAPEELPYTKTYEIVYPDGVVKQVVGLKAISKEFNVSIEHVHTTIKRITEGKTPTRGVFANTTIREVIRKC